MVWKGGNRVEGGVCCCVGWDDWCVVVYVYGYVYVLCVVCNVVCQRVVVWIGTTIPR